MCLSPVSLDRTHLIQVLRLGTAGCWLPSGPGSTACRITGRAFGHGPWITEMQLPDCRLGFDVRYPEGQGDVMCPLSQVEVCQGLTGGAVLVGLSTNMVAASRSTVRNSSSAVSSQSEGDTDNEEDGDNQGGSRDEISQLAEQLENSPALADHLQVINEEDLAAILPDVETADPVDDATFDPFEDVSSESAKNGTAVEKKAAASAASSSSTATAGASTSHANESESDVELPAQVVRDAIKRIQIDAEDKLSTAGHADSVDDGDNDSSDGDNRHSVYSSSLLQQFVESTERLSGKRSSGSNRSGSKRGTSTGKSHANKQSSRRRRGRPLKPESSHHPDTAVAATGADSSSAVAAKPHLPGPAELEVYCSVSNVSPDSGIYCVAGSPWHQSSPAHSPQHPLQQKALPSPPHLTKSRDKRSGKKDSPKIPSSRSKSVKKVEHSRLLEHQRDGCQRDSRVPPIHLDHDSDDEVPPPSPLLSAPARRGPGRPKKAPPILEPCLPVHPKTAQRPSHSSDVGRNRSRKGVASGSPKRSLERCDKLWGKGRSGEVKVTSQGVQCDQSEFAQLSPRKQKKKRRSQVSQGSQGSQGKSLDRLQGSESREREKLHRNKMKVHEDICDRVNKRQEVPVVGGSQVNHLRPPLTPSTKRTLSKVESSSHHRLSSSSSSKKLATSMEKRKKGRRRAQAAQLVALMVNSAALVTKSTGSVATSTTGTGPVTVPTQRLSKPPQSNQQRNSTEKVVCVPHGLKPQHHKHKKHRRRKERRSHHSNDSTIPVDPNFLPELERLITEFQRNCSIARLPQPASRCGEGSKNHLPSIFRVRRIVKKRKGSERSQNSDWDSGPETEMSNLVGAPAARDSRDKGSTGGKRRPKKTSVETPKGRERPEANNEQRLPLKKRHYHVSTTAPANQLSPSTSSHEVSTDLSSSPEEKLSEKGGSASSINKSNATTDISQSAQSGKGSPAPSGGKHSPHMNVTSIGVKTNVVTVVTTVPSIGKAITVTSANTSIPVSSVTSKAISTSVSTVTSKIISTSANTGPNNVSVVSNVKSCVLGIPSKVSVVTPVASIANRGGIPTLGSVTSVACSASIPSIISKANAAASFASICNSNIIPDVSNTTRKSSVVSALNDSQVFPNNLLPVTSKNSLPTMALPINKEGVDSSFNSTAQSKMSPAVTSCSLTAKGNIGVVATAKSTHLDCFQVSISKASAITPVISETSVITSTSSVASKTSPHSATSVVSKTSSQASVITITSKTPSMANTNAPLTSSKTPSPALKVPVVQIGPHKIKQSGEMTRNSIDEAIEACISRYASGMVSTTSVLPTRSVITTPKKRHRMEMQGKSSVGTGKGKEGEIAIVSSPPPAQPGKRSNSRTAHSTIPPAPNSPLPLAQATPSGGTKLPESGIFEPSSSSEDYVDLPLPATPVKSVIAVLSKLKGTTSGKSSPTVPVGPEDTLVLTSHNLRQKKVNHVSEAKPLTSDSRSDCESEANVESESVDAPSTLSDHPSQDAALPTPEPSSTLEKCQTTTTPQESALLIGSECSVTLEPRLPSTAEMVCESPPVVGTPPIIVPMPKRAPIIETVSAPPSAQVFIPVTDSSTEVKVEGQTNFRSTAFDRKDNRMKDVRIHVKKLSSDMILQRAIGMVNKQRSRRRKCNRTGFPVKRKKKKKSQEQENLSDKAVSKNPKSSVIPPPAHSMLESVNKPSDPSELRTSSRVQNRKEQTSKKENSETDLAKQKQPLEEVCDTSKVKMEHKESVSVLDVGHSEQSVIVKYEDCPVTSDIKEELKLVETFDDRFKARSLRVQNSGDQSPFIARSDDSMMADDEEPSIGMLLKREITDVADLTRRNKPKTKLVRTKEGKAVLRAMRAKFAEENTAIPTLTCNISKNHKVHGPSYQSWSSDESDDCTALRRSPGKLYQVGVMSNDNLNAEGTSDQKVTKREMKRQANSFHDEPIKTKCAKSSQDVESTVSKSKVKMEEEGRLPVDSRTRGKRKIDGREDGLTSAESRRARSKKRLRTLQRLEADSIDTDCDESVIEARLSSTPAPGDAPSEDEAPRNAGKETKQPRWRKKFLPAGLFSEYFKLDEPRLVADGKKGLQYKAEDHPHGLLPPPYHCGKWLRQRKINFQLPYDLWWLHTHSRLPGRDLVPSWNYKKIRTNVYTSVKPAYVHEPQACNCKIPETETERGKGCGDDCINRLVYTECIPGLCPLRDSCSNQRIQRHEWAPGLDKFMTKDKGWGVRTKLPIKSGEFILEYVGEVVSDREFKERMASRYTRDTHHYCLHLDGGLVIDGHRMGGDGRFVNHSCEPNCEMQKWSVNGLFRMALFAMRDIEPLEELAYDYNFSLFNPADGQPCKCGSTRCRGVIGGKSQRVNGTPATQNGNSKNGSTKVSVEDAPERKGSRKNKRKTCRRNDGERAAENMRQRKRMEAQRLSQLLALNIRHMSHQQRSFVQQHHCFLLRNLEKVRRLKERLKQASQRPDSFTRPAPANVKQSDVFLTQLNALSTPRNVRTRRLAQAEDNPELTRSAKLACILRDLYTVVVAAKDDNGDVLSSPFMTLPNKRKLPLYYERIREPIDFSTVEQNINSGLYPTLEIFDQDVCRILNNNIRFYGRTSQLGIYSVRLRKVYMDAKKEALPQLMDVLGEALPAGIVTEKDPAEEEDVIRCICGLYRDEGMMIQCERCLVWQHCDCVRADSSVEHYLCEVCHPRDVDLEIIMDPPPSYATEGQINYVTLMRSNLQIRQGDTVYVLRDVTEGEGPSQAKVTYKTIKDPKYADMDIFRIERLWKDEKGDRFAFGHHFLRPHETYHEPTRKFYPNEVMRVPLYEIISLDLIWARCWVLDPNTYCKGRPVEAVEEHVYICEYRVDKTAHLFSKISKSCRAATSPICTKSYAFETFDTRLKPVRTYTPHGTVAPVRPKNRNNGCSHGDDSSSTKSLPQQSPIAEEDEDEEVPLARVRASAIAEKRARQRNRLNNILLGLLARLPTKQPLDLSYLLEPNRRHRKKPAALNT